MKFISRQKKNLKVPVLLAVLLGALFTSSIYAGLTGAIGLSTIAGQVGSTVRSLASIISDIAIVAGIGFVLASFFKFDQHKKNPTQIPISQPLTLLLIGAGLCVLPSVIPTVQTAVFGTGVKKGTIGGVSSLIGS